MIIGRSGRFLEGWGRRREDEPTGIRQRSFPQFSKRSPLPEGGHPRPTGQQSHDYRYSPLGLIHESNPNSIYIPGIGKRTNGILTYFHGDWLDSTRYTSRTGGVATEQLRYDAWGNRMGLNHLDPNNPANPLNPFHPTDFQWGGGWGYQTESAFPNEPGLGLVYMQQRYYDPLLGRFISQDPIGHLGGLNLYAYVFNDPVNAVDPSGLQGADLPLPGIPPEPDGPIEEDDNSGDPATISNPGPAPSFPSGRGVPPGHPGGPRSPGRTGSGPAGLFRMQPALPAFIPPRGFANITQFESFVARYRAASGDPDALIGVRGSATTGVSFKTGQPFGPGSDIDFFIVSKKVYYQAIKRGARPKRGALHISETRRINRLFRMSEILTNELKRDVSIRIFSPRGYELERDNRDVFGR